MLDIFNHIFYKISNISENRKIKTRINIYQYNRITYNFLPQYNNSKNRNNKKKLFSLKQGFPTFFLGGTLNHLINFHAHFQVKVINISINCQK